MSVADPSRQKRVHELDDALTSTDIGLQMYEVSTSSVDKAGPFKINMQDATTFIFRGLGRNGMSGTALADGMHMWKSTAHAFSEAGTM